jgi:hypothetical protein
MDVQILGPIVLHPAVNYGAPGDEFFDAVGAITERRLERGCADVAPLARCVALSHQCLGSTLSCPRITGSTAEQDVRFTNSASEIVGLERFSGSGLTK